jgi:hypothetical protein
MQLASLVGNFLFINRANAQEVVNDTIFLKDGTFLTGYIVNPESRESIRIKNEGGLTLYVTPERIQRISVNRARLEDKSLKKSGPPTLTEERIAFGLRAGGAFPFGDFSAVLGAFPGYAKTGWSAEADVWVRVSNQFYWSTKFGYSTNAIKESAFASQFESSNPVSVLQIFTGNWSGWHFLTGFSTQRPLDERFSYFFQGHLGFSRFNSPGIYILTAGPTLYYLESVKGAGVSVAFTGGLRLWDKYSASLSLLSSNPTFVLSSAQGGATRQPVRIINLSVGILLYPNLKSQLSKS